MEDPTTAPSGVEVETENYIIVVTTVSLLGLLLVLGAVANVVLILAFNRRPALRSISNRFVGNLLVVNLFSTLVLIPFVCVDLLTSGRRRNELLGQSVRLHHPCSFQCFLEEFASSSIAAASLLSTLLIALDQYLAILFPLRYHHLLTSCKAWISISLAWTVALSVGSVKSIRRASLVSFYQDSHLNATTIGQEQFDQDVRGSQLFSSAIFVAVFVLPSILLAFIYGRIYIEAHKNSVRIRREKLNPVRTMFNTAIKITDRMGDPIKKKKKKKGGKKPSFTFKLNNDEQEQVSEASNDEVTPLNGNTPSLPRHPAPGHLERSRTTGCLMNSKTPSPRPTGAHPLKRSHSQQLMHSIRHKLSNASQFMHRHKEEMHTARISLVSVILVLICWLPYYVVGLFLVDSEPVVAAVENSDHLWVTCFVDVMIALYTVLSPCVFAYRCKRLQREVGRLFRAFRRMDDHDLSLPRRTFHLLKPSQRPQDINVVSARSEAMQNLPATPLTPSLILTVPTDVDENQGTTTFKRKFNCLSLHKLSSPANSKSSKETGPPVVTIDSQRSSISSASDHSAATIKSFKRYNCLSLPKFSAQSVPAAAPAEKIDSIITRDDSQRSSISSASGQSVRTNTTSASERRCSNFSQSKKSSPSISITSKRSERTSSLKTNRNTTPRGSVSFARIQSESEEGCDGQELNELLPKTLSVPKEDQDNDAAKEMLDYNMINDQQKNNSTIFIVKVQHNCVPSSPPNLADETKAGNKEHNHVQGDTTPLTNSISFIKNISTLKTREYKCSSLSKLFSPAISIRTKKCDSTKILHRDTISLDSAQSTIRNSVNLHDGDYFYASLSKLSFSPTCAIAPTQNEDAAPVHVAQDMSPRRLAALARSQLDPNHLPQKVCNNGQCLLSPPPSISMLTNRSLQNLTAAVKEGAQRRARFSSGGQSMTISSSGVAENELFGQKPKLKKFSSEPPTETEDIIERRTREIRIEISQA